MENKHTELIACLLLFSDALSEVEKATTHINNLVHYQENMQRVVAIQRCFTGGCKPVIVTPGRKLIKEGRLLKVKTIYEI